MLIRFIVCIVFLSTFTWAHPHVFIDTKVDVLPEKIIITWSFDEMNSAMLMEDYDKNKDKKLDPDEIAFMEKDHFKTLEPYSYFIHMSDGKDEFNLKRIIEFTAAFENKKTHLHLCHSKTKIQKIRTPFLRCRDVCCAHFKKRVAYM